MPQKNVARCSSHKISRNIKKADTRVSAWENCFAILLNLHYCTRAISYSFKKVLQAYTPVGLLFF